MVVLRTGLSKKDMVKQDCRFTTTTLHYNSKRATRFCSSFALLEVAGDLLMVAESDLGCLA
jgi:hypothetical protein